MFSSNAHQHCKLGLCLGSLPLLDYFLPHQFSPIWIISSGDFQKMVILAIFPGYYGIFGKIEMKRFIRIRMEIHRKYYELPK